MKKFFKDLLIGIKKYFKTFEDNTIQYLKINVVALLIIVAAITCLTVWLWPSEKNIDAQIYTKNSELAKNFNVNTQEYVDTKKGLQLELQLKEIQAIKKNYKIIDLAIYSLILTILTGFLATLLQAIYTKLKFTDNAESAQRVLSAALFSSAFIVCIVFIVFYYQMNSAL